MKNPLFLMVLTATESFAYQKEDGVICCANWLFKKLNKINHFG